MAKLYGVRMPRKVKKRIKRDRDIRLFEWIKQGRNKTRCPF
jgi:hypothetical protein